jgi:hypothetical protein
MSDPEYAAFCMGVILGVVIMGIVFAIAYVATGSHSHPRRIKDKDHTWPR